MIAVRIANASIASLALIVVAACQNLDVSRDVGARCTANADCNQLCLTAAGGWPGGMCTLPCDGDASCPSNTACIVDQTIGVCAFRCATDADCAFLDGGYTCKPIDRHNPDTGQTVMVCHA